MNNSKNITELYSENLQKYNSVPTKIYKIVESIKEPDINNLWIKGDEKRIYKYIKGIWEPISISPNDLGSINIEIDNYFKEYDLKLTELQKVINTDFANTINVINNELQNINSNINSNSLSITNNSNEISNLYSVINNLPQPIEYQGSNTIDITDNVISVKNLKLSDTSVLLGINACGASFKNVAIGGDSYAGQGGIAIGYGASASMYSVSIGVNTSIYSSNQIVIATGIGESKPSDDSIFNIMHNTVRYFRISRDYEQWNKGDITCLGEDGNPEHKLSEKLNASEKGIANGIATLGEDGKVLSEQLPDTIGTSGQDGKTYIPSVNLEGDLSWTVDGEDSGILPINIMGSKGEQGNVGPQGPIGEQGLKGEDGKSAYELAVENGFSGTIEEWLESLKGDKGDTGPQGPAGETDELEYILPQASNDTLGGIKTGYAQSGTTYPVKLSDEQRAYVDIPSVGLDCMHHYVVLYTSTLFQPGDTSSIPNISSWESPGYDEYKRINNHTGNYAYFGQYCMVYKPKIIIALKESPRKNGEVNFITSNRYMGNAGEICDVYYNVWMNYIIPVFPVVEQIESVNTSITIDKYLLTIDNSKPFTSEWIIDYHTDTSNNDSPTFSFVLKSSLTSTE